MSYIPEKIKKAIDLGQWKHSWHNKFKTIEDYRDARQVIKEGIQERIIELQLLSTALDEIDITICREREYLQNEED